MQWGGGLSVCLASAATSLHGALPGAGSASVDVRARVLVPVEVVAIDSGVLDFGMVNPGQTTVPKVNPITDGAKAAAFKITGSTNMTVELVYPASVNIENISNPGALPLVLVPLVSGNTTNSQITSSLLPGPPATAVMNGTGEYFFWMGAEITNMSDMVVGDYAGEFTVTVEYEL